MDNLFTTTNDVELNNLMLGEGASVETNVENDFYNREEIKTNLPTKDSMLASVDIGLEYNKKKIEKYKKNLLNINVFSENLERMYNETLLNTSIWGYKHANSIYFMKKIIDKSRVETLEMICFIQEKQKKYNDIKEKINALDSINIEDDSPLSSLI